jgi:hypothetical protein
MGFSAHTAKGIVLQDRQSSRKTEAHIPLTGQRLKHTIAHKIPIFS